MTLLYEDKDMKKLTLPSVVILSAALLCKQVSANQKCKSADIKVNIQFGEEIKVLKVNFWDKEIKNGVTTTLKTRPLT